MHKTCNKKRIKSVYIRYHFAPFVVNFIYINKFFGICHCHLDSFSVCHLRKSVLMTDT